MDGKLKTALENELSHVVEIFFDEVGNWFIHKTVSTVTSLSRDEILKVKKTKPTTEKE